MCVWRYHHAASTMLFILSLHLPSRNQGTKDMDAIYIQSYLSLCSKDANGNAEVVCILLILASASGSLPWKPDHGTLKRDLEQDLPTIQSSCRENYQMWLPMEEI
jgi:hypothetical protein